MKTIDVTDWEVAAENPSGAREKIWLINPSNKEKYLFKKPQSEGERIGEVASYCLGTEIFNLKIPETVFAERAGVLGTISKSFIPEGEQTYLEFQEIVDYFGDDFDEYDLTEYTLMKSLEIVKQLGVKENFFEMCLFDYLIANQDRHVQNWGILTNQKTNEKYFSPLYDNGSSLFSGYKDEQLLDFLRDNNKFQAYTNRARSLFFYEKKKPKFISILQALLANDQQLFVHTFKKFQHKNSEVISELLVQRVGVSELRSKLIVKLIIYRTQKIEQLINDFEVN
ncbi:HipA domain-containing protein [Enterococcus sp. CSURQ0835]|uniref:HipA domain-containing protein n=1 Tax=Enterococcus sp. CSURQ0835 TaxID=2681394 RepID=UPI00135777B2|nr:HipA domain-containing protein [Enterococcus sp. CSURQ0835]